MKADINRDHRFQPKRKFFILIRPALSLIFATFQNQGTFVCRNEFVVLIRKMLALVKYCKQQMSVCPSKHMAHFIQCMPMQVACPIDRPHLFVLLCKFIFVRPLTPNSHLPDVVFDDISCASQFKCYFYNALLFDIGSYRIGFTGTIHLTMIP